MAAYISSASLNSVVGCVFRHLRNISDVGQLELAEITNLPASTISKIESGSINITIELIFMLCSYYQISLTEFFKILETAIESLHDDKVFIYLTKTEFVTIKEHTISMAKDTSMASAGVFSDTSGKIAAATAATATTALAGGILTLPVFLGASALLAISNPILGALSASRKNKELVSTEKLVEKAVDKKISAIGEASEEEMIDLPILPAKQIYRILKETLDNLPIEKLSKEQKSLYKIFAEKNSKPE